MGNLLSRARGLKDKPPTYPYAAPTRFIPTNNEERTRNTKRPVPSCPDDANRRTLASTSPFTRPTGASLGRLSLFPGPHGEEALQGRERRLDVPRLRLHEGTHLCVAMRAIGWRVRTAEAVSSLARHGSMLQVTPNETQRRRSTGRATRALK